MNKLLALSMILLSTTSFAADLDKTIPAGTMRLFLLEHTNGNITITGTTDSDIHIQTHKVRGDDNCFSTVETTDVLLDMQTTRLDLTVDPCVVDATITLPKTMEIDVTMGSGNVTVQNMTGNINVSVNAGTVTARGSFLNAIFQVGVGKLDATWESVPKVSALTFDVGQGEVILNFPKGTAITTELDPGRAKVATHAYITEGVPFKVIGSMRSGNLAIQ